MVGIDEWGEYAEVRSWGNKVKNMDGPRRKEGRARRHFVVDFEPRLFIALV